MSTVKPEDFIQNIYTNGNTSEHDGSPQYPFDSRKAQELLRLNEQHHSFIELLRDRLVHAPVDRPKRILDLGCGTGITTFSIARKFPDAEVIGIDMNPVPAMSNKPPNVTFVQAKIEDIKERVNSTQPSQSYTGLPSPEMFRKGSFDYIFSRLLTLAVADWPGLISTCTLLLAPGGWLEMHEPASFEFYNEDSPIKPLRKLPNYTWAWTEVLFERSEALGYDLRSGKHLHAHFLESGLNQVSSVHYPQTVYPWPARPETARMGNYLTVYGTQGYPAVLRMFTPDAKDNERQEWERQIAEMSVPEKGGEGLHWRFYVVCGRKE